MFTQNPIMQKIFRGSARHAAGLASWAGIPIMAGLAGQAFAQGAAALGLAITVDALNPVPSPFGLADGLEMVRADPVKAGNMGLNWRR